MSRGMFDLSQMGKCHWHLVHKAMGLPNTPPQRVIWPENVNCAGELAHFVTALSADFC